MNNQFRNCFLASLFFFGFILQNGQAQGFDGSLLFGFNAAQMDEDGLAGFNKLGLTGGIRVAYPIKKRMDLGLELIFSQRGSKSPRNAVDTEFNNLNYFAIPIFVNFKDWYIETEKYHKVRVEAGLTPAYLISASSNQTEVDEEHFREWDFSMHAGFGYRINRRWGFLARYSRSPFKIYQFEDVSRFESYFLSLRFDFLLN